MKAFLTLLVIALSAIQLSGCTTLVVGGVIAGASVMHDRRTTGAYVDDKEILLKAISLRGENTAVSEQTNIDITVYNQRVLLTGQAENNTLAQQFAQQVATIPRVRHVFNEVKITEESSFVEDTSDTYLTSKVKLALFDVNIETFDPTRVSVTSSLGTVYLMGLLSKTEAEAVTEKVRHLSGVKRVVVLFEYI